tara:strand:- start:51 stop:683 length:633 start_codon:yes stop_codon:yes gene_type:complete
MTNVSITKANIETATNAINAIAAIDTSVRDGIAANAKLGKILKRITKACKRPDGSLDNKSFDAALVKLGLRDAKTGKDDKRKTDERDIMSRDNRSLAVQLADKLPAINKALKAHKGKVSSMSGAIALIKPKTASKQKALVQPAGENNGLVEPVLQAGAISFEQAADNFYALCRAKFNMSSIDALAKLQSYDNEKNVEADMKLEQKIAATG